MPARLPLPRASEHLLAQFAEFLAGQQLSKKSTLNYLSDVRRFLASRPDATADHKVVAQAIQEHKRRLLEAGTPLSTINRHLASLRQFAAFLQAVHHLEINPGAVHNISIHPQQTQQLVARDINARLVNNFVSALKAEDCSPSTIKNYAGDVGHFAVFLEENTLTSDRIKPLLAEYWKTISSLEDSPATVKRRQSALRKFYAWAFASKYINYNPFPATVPEIIQSLTEKYTKITPPPAEITQTKTNNRLNRSKSASGNVFARLYRRSYGMPARSFAHVAVLALFVSLVGSAAYRQFFTDAKVNYAFPTTLTRPNRILSFQGRLTDSVGTPITVASNVKFRLFNHITNGTGDAQALWASGTCSITPDQDGVFNTILGSSCGSEISSNVFTENQNIYLELEVGNSPNNETLTPRQQIATVGYALNAETVQGFPASASAVENTVVTMNNSGDVLLGSANPNLKSTSGTFTVEGNALTLATSTSSGGDITLAPDGTGQISVLSSTTTTASLALSNAQLTTGGTLISGNVGNSNSGYKFISFTNSLSPSERFSVNALGNVTATGYLSVPGATISATYSGATPLVINGTGGQIVSVTNAGYLTTASDINTSGGTIRMGGTDYGQYFIDSAGDSGKVWTSDGSGRGYWTTVSGGGGGTVTSVGLSLPSDFIISNSPVTSAGTLTATWNSQLANTILAAPNGSAGTPSFRAIVDNDIPDTITASNYVLKAGDTMTGNLAFNTGSITNVQGIGFNTAVTTSPAEGFMNWNDNRGFLELGLKGGYVLEVGQQLVKRVTNKTTADIPKGKVVYINGGLGQRPTITPASNASESSSSKTFGITGEAINQNNDGFVVVVGPIYGIDTTGYTAGQTLYLATDGNFTNIKPTAPAHMVAVGKVITVGNATTGVIEVSIQNGFELDELHNATFSGILNNDVFSYDSGTGLWKNRQLSNLTFGSYLTNTASTYNGSSANTINVDATDANTASKIVARNADGNFSAGNITASSFIKSGGTSSQFLKADGSVDSSTYLTTISGLDHNSLGNLTVGDPHTQYALLAGRSGGQTLIGGTASGNNLTLQSTSDGTKGKILFGTSAYDEVNNRLGINTSSPGYGLDVQSTTNLAGGLYLSGAAGTSGQVLISNGTSAPSWRDLTSLSGSYWQKLTGGSPSVDYGIAPINNSWDLLVGGTSTASAKFQVTSAGNATMSGTLTVGNGATNQIQTPYGPLSLMYKSGANAWTAGLTVRDVTGNVGIGTTTPQEKLEVNGSVFTNADNAGTIVDSGNFKRVGLMKYYGKEGGIWREGATDFEIGRVTSGTLTSATAWTTDFYVSDTGNVGVGNTAPPALFSVGSTSQFQVNSSGNVTFASTLTPTANFTLGSNSYTGAIDTSDWDISATGVMTGISGITTDGAYTQSGTSANTFSGTSTFSNATYSALFTGGNVGIGTTTPSSVLDVIGVGGSGNVFLVRTKPASQGGTDGQGGIVIKPNYASGMASIQGTNNQLNAVANILLNPEGGNVGINNLSPNYPLDVTGDINTSGNYRFNTTSGGAIYAGATNVMAINNTTIAIQSGVNLAIGTAAPMNKLDVEGGAVIGAGYSGTNTAPTNGLLVEGNVGIGVTSTVAKLDVAGTNLGTNSLFLRSGDDGTFGADSEQIAFAWGGNLTNTYAHNIRTRHNGVADAGNAIDFYVWDFGTDAATTLGTKFVMTMNGGNVGIGVGSPVNKLDVEGGAVIGATYSGTNTAPTNGLLVEGTLSVGTSAPTGSTQIVLPTFTDHNTNSQHFLITNSSDLDNGLHVGVDAGNNAVFMNVINPNVAWGNLYLQTAGTGGAGGSVGIGTNTIGSRLQVNGNLTVGSQTAIAAPTNGLSVVGGTTIGYSTNTSAPTNGLTVNGYTGLGLSNALSQLHVVLPQLTNHDTNNQQFIITNGTSDTGYLVAGGSDEGLRIAVDNVNNRAFINYLDPGVLWGNILLATSPTGSTASNVGIGRLVPSATLDVDGTASISGILTLGNGTTNQIQPAFGPLTLAYKSGANTWASAMTIRDISGNIGIGTATPLSAVELSSGNLHVRGNQVIFDSNLATTGGAANFIEGNVDSGGSAAGTATDFWFQSRFDDVVIQAGINDSNKRNITLRSGLTNVGLTVNTLGNVAIGTTSAQQKLEVVATQGSLTGSLGQRGIISAFDNTPQVIDGGAALALGGKYNDGGSISVFGAIKSGKTNSTTAQANGYLSFLTAPSSGILTEKLRILDTGNVGIGTSTAVNLLDVNGGVAIGATYAGTNTAPTNGLLVEGNVGIGLTSTTAKLDVSGNASVSGNLTLAGGARTIQTTAFNGLTIGGATTGNITLSPLNNAAGGAVLPGSNTNTNLGGTANRWGCLYYNNGTTGTCASDIRLKQNISSLIFDNALSKLTGLKMKSYVYRSDASGNVYNGLIAQEVEQIAPELVLTGEDGYKMIKYGDIQWLTIQAIQQQQSLISSLQNISLNASGNVVLADQGNDSYSATLPDGTPIVANSAYNNSSIANLRAGLVDALTIKVNGRPLTDVVREMVQQVVAQNTGTTIASTEKLSTKIVESETVRSGEVQTQTLKATESATIALRLDPSVLSITANQDGSNVTVARFDTNGNATFSGELNAKSARLETLEVAQNNIERGLFGTATISGTLFAQRLQAESIAGLDDQLTLSANNTVALATQAASLAGSSAGSKAAQELLNSLLAPNDASTEAILAELNSLTGRNLTAKDTLRTQAMILDTALDVRGLARIANASITNNLNVGGTLQISKNSIEFAMTTGANQSISDTLYIQPSGNGSIDLLAGALKIESGGIITVNGDIFVNGSMHSKEILTDTFSINAPTTATPSALGALLTMYNDDGSTVAQIDASGSAQFREVNTRGIVIAAPTDAQQSVGATPTANATAGKAVLPANQTEITIPNTLVQANTLVYLTPLSNTQNQVLYVKAKQDGQSFTVAINSALPQDVEFNYWLIKVE